MLFFSVGTIFGLAKFCIVLDYITIQYAVCLSTLLQGIVIEKQCLTLGGKPLTVGVVFQEVETVPIVKNCGGQRQQKHARMYVIPVCDITLFFAPMRRIFTRVLSVPGTSASFLWHSYPCTKAL